MGSPAPSATPLNPQLRQRTIALVGLMGVGKSSLGRRLAAALDLPFRDADEEIEKAAGCSIPEIFAEMGEAEFRAGERRVISRLLDDPPHILATGGGAFVQDETRAILKSKALTVWLKADVEVLARRVARKEGSRPLLTGKDPLATLTELAEKRYPYYAQADIQVETGETPHTQALQAVLQALENHIQKISA